MLPPCDTLQNRNSKTSKIQKKQKEKKSRKNVRVDFTPKNFAGKSWKLTKVDQI
jgi:hypothetical protein